MSDLIRRKDALAYPLSWEHYDMENGDVKFMCGVESYREYIESLPSAHQWIPCSERLPENRSYVLTTIHVPGRSPHSRSGWFEHDLFMNDNGDTWKCTDREVIAWMPLPEPYKGKADGPIR